MLAHLHKPELHLLILLHLKFSSLGSWLANMSWLTSNSGNSDIFQHSLVLENQFSQFLSTTGSEGHLFHTYNS